MVLQPFHVTCYGKAGFDTFLAYLQNPVGTDGWCAQWEASAVKGLERVCAVIPYKGNLTGECLFFNNRRIPVTVCDVNGIDLARDWVPIHYQVWDEENKAYISTTRDGKALYPDDEVRLAEVLGIKPQ